MRRQDKMPARNKKNFRLTKKGGFVAKGCGAIMSNRKKKTKIV